MKKNMSALEEIFEMVHGADTVSACEELLAQQRASWALYVSGARYAAKMLSFSAELVERGEFGMSEFPGRRFVIRQAVKPDSVEGYVCADVFDGKRRLYRESWKLSELYEMCNGGRVSLAKRAA